MWKRRFYDRSLGHFITGFEKAGENPSFVGARRGSFGFGFLLEGNFPNCLIICWSFCGIGVDRDIQFRNSVESLSIETDGIEIMIIYVEFERNRMCLHNNT